MVQLTLWGLEEGERKFPGKIIFSIRFFIWILFLCAGYGLGNSIPWYVTRSVFPDTFSVEKSRQVVIAVVDDGFRTTHRDILPFLWKNPKETPNNRMDDDGNGFVDDLVGWDVSDGDNDVNPPQGKLETYHHGTTSAGIIAAIAGQYHLENQIKIVPVKSLSDNAEKTYLKDAYQGIEYAINLGVDIISCSWGGGSFGSYEKALLEKAREKGIVIVGSVGNFYQSMGQYPAAFPSVISVAAVDSSDKKIERSNYGLFVDVSAPGEKILAPSVFSDTGKNFGEGTSAAAPIVTALVAMMKLKNPQLSLEDIDVCLKNSADAIDSLNIKYSGLLGAGRINALGAITCAEQVPMIFTSRHRKAPKGHLAYQRSSVGFWKRWFGSMKSPKIEEWHVTPYGSFKGFWFWPSSVSQTAGTFRFVGQSSDLQLSALTFAADSLPDSVFVPGNSSLIQFKPTDATSSINWKLEYSVATIDSSKLFCKDKKMLTEESFFEDGSGSLTYSRNSDCKWLITAPAGKVVELRFLEFDTQAQTDWVYAHNGDGTHTEILGIFSGSKIPPRVTSTGQTLMVWFVTDNDIQGQGWKAQFKFVDQKHLSEEGP